MVNGVMKALSFSKREEVKAWEQEFIPCEHTLCLVQQDNGDFYGNGKDTLVPLNAKTTPFPDLIWF